MSLITLTTDWGTADYYVGSVKGTILKQLPDVTIVDITHDIAAYNILQTAFILKNCYQNFPEGSVHIIGVDAEANVNVSHIALKIYGHYFIGADNGIFSLMFDRKPDAIVELELASESNFATFPTKDIFVKAACHLARGGTMEVIGKKRDHVEERTLIQPVVENNIIRGSVVHIDHFDNVVTNITRELFTDIGKNRPFTIFFRKQDYNINTINTAYYEVPEGEKLALFTNNQQLQIAINKGQAAGLLGLKLNDTIRVEFE